MLTIYLNYGKIILEKKMTEFLSPELLNNIFCLNNCKDAEKIKNYLDIAAKYLIDFFGEDFREKIIGKLGKANYIVIPKEIHQAGQNAERIEQMIKKEFYNDVGYIVEPEDFDEFDRNFNIIQELIKQDNIINSSGGLNEEFLSAFLKVEKCNANSDNLDLANENEILKLIDKIKEDFIEKYDIFSQNYEISNFKIDSPDIRKNIACETFVKIFGKKYRPLLKEKELKEICYDLMSKDKKFVTKQDMASYFLFFSYFQDDDEIDIVDYFDKDKLEKAKKAFNKRMEVINRVKKDMIYQDLLENNPELFEYIDQNLEPIAKARLLRDVLSFVKGDVGSVAACVWNCTNRSCNDKISFVILPEETTNENFIHELCHVISFSVIRDIASTNYFGGLDTKAGLSVSTMNCFSDSINEIVTQYFAEIIAEKMVNNNEWTFNKEDDTECLYSFTFEIFGEFLRKNEQFIKQLYMGDYGEFFKNISQNDYILLCENADKAMENLRRTMFAYNYDKKFDHYQQISKNAKTFLSELSQRLNAGKTAAEFSECQDAGYSDSFLEEK